MPTINLTAHEAKAAAEKRLRLIVRPVKNQPGPEAYIANFEGRFFYGGLLGDIPENYRTGWVRCPLGIRGDVLADVLAELANMDRGNNE